MNQIGINYVDGKFRVTVPFGMGDLLNSVVSKKWVKMHRYWEIAPVRKNIEALMDLASMASVSQPAREALKRDSLATAEVSGFPLNYVYKTMPLAIQKKALDKAYGRTGFAIHMDRGCGKSKIVIDIASALFMNGKIDAVLIMVQRSLRMNWAGYDHGIDVGQREGFIGHSPIECRIHIPNGGDAAAMRAFTKWLQPGDELPVLIMSIESLSQGGGYDIADKYTKVYDSVLTCIDESQSIANHNSIRSTRAHALGSMSRYRVTCTGTPIQSGPMNLFSQFEFLDPNIIGIGDFYAFRNRYAIMGGYVNPTTGKPMQIVAYRNINELVNTVAPYVFECQKSEVLDLPDKVYERRHIELAPGQRALYKRVKSEKVYEFGNSAVTVQNSLELALRLQQIVGGFISNTHTDERGKRVSDWCEVVPDDRNPKILEVIEIAAEGKPMIVWCVYRIEIRAVVKALRTRFPDEEILEIHGGVDEEGRDIAKAKFQSGQARILVGNTASGGTGLTLTACEIMVYFNNSNRMVDRLQSEDRAHRIGLKHSVLYIDLIALNTIDVTIMRAIEHKVDLSEYMRLNIRRVNDLLDGKLDGFNE